MKTTIQSIHFDADKKLLEFINTKCDKLDKYFDAIIGSEVYLKLEKNKTSENKVVEIKINVPSNTLLAKEQCKTFEEAVDNCVDNLKNQLVKFKEKIKD